MAPPDAAPPDRPSEQHDSELDQFAHPNRRRLLFVVGAVVLIGSAFILGHWYDAYRAIVLDVRADQMLLGFAKKPPDWVDGRITEPGTIVVKEPWRWDLNRHARRDPRSNEARGLPRRDRPHR